MQAYSKLIASDDAIAKELSSLERRGQTWQKDVQTVLTAIIARWQSPKGDVRQVVKHANAMNAWNIEGARLNSLRQWWCDRGLVYDEDTKVFSYASTKSTEDIKSLPLWYKAIKDPDFKPLDAWEEVSKLIAKLEKRKSKGNDGDVIPALLLTQLREVVKTKETEEA